MKTLKLKKGTSENKDEVILEFSPFGRDWILKIYGGEAHLGAIARSGQPDVFSSVWGSHKEQVVVETAYRKIAPLLSGELLVVAGIHYDQISPQQIENILANMVDLLHDLQQSL